MELDQPRLERALREVQDALRPYHQMQLDFEQLVAAWQLLEPGARRRIAQIAPVLVDALIQVEWHQGRLSDVES